MINEKLKKAEDLGEQGKVDEAQKALEEAEALKKLPTRQEPVVDNSNSSKYIAADVWIVSRFPVFYNFNEIICTHISITFQMMHQNI
ncbi:luc7-like protein [Arachis ipaensis]|uniref:luc7-like protein n=1 Tax=Arachis ipaensis TaxID=130454 RepID=UPI000A2B4D36|nr:luc7-like protein [Arachis ipaensis]